LKILKGKDNLEDWANMEDNIKMDHQEMWGCELGLPASLQGPVLWTR
jgi:hypothetical protein